MQQDTTTMTLSGTSAGLPESPAPEGDTEAQQEAAPVAPRPSYGYNKDGPPELTQGVLSLAVSGDGGLPLRLGRRDWNTRDSTDTPLAIEEWLALGLQGGPGHGGGQQSLEATDGGPLLRAEDWPCD